MTSLTSGRFQPPLSLTEGNTVDFVFRLSNNGTLFTPPLTPVWIFGIKDANTPNGDFLIQVNSATVASGVYTFVVELASAELQTWLATATSQSYAAIQITDSANDIATAPLLCQIATNQNDTGTTPTSANGTLSVAAGKTVTFPQSLTFPSALGTNTFQLSTDGAGTLTWTAAGGVTDGYKGDITVSASGATWKIDNDVVGLAQLAHMATDRVVGRTTPGNGSPELLTISGTGSVAMTGSPTFSNASIGDGTTLYMGQQSPLRWTGAPGSYIELADISAALPAPASSTFLRIATDGDEIIFRSFDTGRFALKASTLGTGASSTTLEFPNIATGVICAANATTTATHALFGTATAGAPGFRAIATADIASALTAPGAIGGTTPSTVAATTTSLKGATSGVVTLAAPATATTATLTFAPSASVTMTPPATSFTAARTDAGQTFNGTAVTKNIFAGSGDTVRFDTGVIFTYDTTVANSYATTQFSTTSGNAGSVTVPAFRLWAGGTGTGMYGTGYENISFATASTRRGGWSSAGAFDLTGTLAVSGASTLTGAVTTANFIAGVEMTAPAAPAANGYRIYADDNGSGKTRLMVLFATGGAQQIAIEP